MRNSWGVSQNCMLNRMIMISCPFDCTPILVKLHMIIVHFLYSNINVNLSWVCRFFFIYIQIKRLYFYKSENFNMLKNNILPSKIKKTFFFTNDRDRMKMSTNFDLFLKTFSMDNTWSSLVILFSTYPHLLESRQGY